MGSFPYLAAASRTGAPYGAVLHCATMLERCERLGWSFHPGNLCGSLCEPQWREAMSDLTYGQLEAVEDAYKAEKYRRMREGIPA